MITDRLIDSVIEYWRENCPKIMESQRKYNEIAMEASIKRLESMKENH